MSRNHLVIGDPHAHFEHDNKRAVWLGHLINDLKPDVVVCLGDTADMPSLSSYDRGKRSFQGRTYQADILAHEDFQGRLWDVVRSSKKRLPLRVTLIGNHEQRIERAIEIQPELEGVISYDDLELERYYDEVIYYEGSTPGVKELDGILYAHYMVSGISNRPISSEHSAYTLLSKHHVSCVVGHSHLFDYCLRTKGDGLKVQGLVAGCYLDWEPSFAGEANKLWWRGICHLKNVDSGRYDLETISLESIKNEYDRK
jgi:hypothetical protein